MITFVLFILAAIVCFAYAPKASAAILVTGLVMFLYVWIFDPQCQNFAKDHPEWHGKCGIEFR